MKKRVCSVLLATLMVLSCLSVGAMPVFADFAATVTVASVTGDVGQIVEVPVSITANSYLVNGDMFVTYDTDVLQLVPYYTDPDDETAKVCYQVNNDIFNNKWMYAANEKEPGLFVFAGASNGKTGITKGGEMFRLAFKILNAEADGAQITFTADPFCANDGTGVTEDGLVQDSTVALTAVNGTVTVAAGLRGDMDGNGDLNMMDALLLYSGIAHGTIDPTNTYVADYNGDGTANMMDALFLYTAMST